MIELNLRHLEIAVIVLASLAMGLALLVYCLMEIRHRRQIAHNARRLILASKLYPPLTGEALQGFWLQSGRRDRDLIEDVLVDMCRTGGADLRVKVEQSIIDSGIYQRWTAELHKGRISRRVRAAVYLGFVHEFRGVYELMRAAESPSAEVRLAVVLSLGRLKDPRGLPALLSIAAKPSKEIPDFTLAAALAGCAEKSPGSLANFLRSPQARARMVAAWALSEVADKSVLKYLLASARDPEPEVRAKVARALARIAGPESTELLRRMAQDPIWYVRVRALDALGKLQTSSEEETVLQGLQDKVRDVRYRAAFALRQIVGMKGEEAAKVLSNSPRHSFDSLISEWDRAGFLWHLVGGLSPRNFPRFLEAEKTLRILIGAGVVRVLAHFILVYPDLKVRLRLLRLFHETLSPEARAELAAVGEHPRCDRRVAAAIKKAFTGSDALQVAGVNPSSA